VVVLRGYGATAFTSTWNQFREFVLGYDSGTGGVFRFSIDSGNAASPRTLFATAWNSSGYATARSDIEVPFGEPVVVATTWDNVTLKVFINGRLCGSIAATSNVSMATGALHLLLDSPNDAGEWADSEIYAHYIWSDAKSEVVHTSDRA
jgi:hypothetical protein